MLRTVVAQCYGQLWLNATDSCGSMLRTVVAQGPPFPGLHLVGITEPAARPQPTKDNTPLLLLVGFEHVLSMIVWQKTVQ